MPSKTHFKDGKYPRIGGPAWEDVEDGANAWYFEGKHHRVNGPAWTLPSSGYLEWWLMGYPIVH